MHKLPSLSIVVPSRTGRVEGLRNQLNRQSFRDWELIVNTEPPTPGQARNLGAAGAKGKWLVFIDDDVQLGHEHLLANLAEALESVGERAVVGVPCQLTPGATSFQKRMFRESFNGNISCDTKPLVEVPWRDSVNGRCMAMSRQLFEELGGFDGRLPSGEEPELLYRHCQRSGKIYLLGNHWVYYAPPETFRVAIRKTVWYERGNVQLTRKHPESNHRMVLRSPLHAVIYLLFRTVGLPALCFVKVSYHYRLPRLQWRPISAFLSYLGAWVYCFNWFSSPAGSYSG